PKAAIKTGAEGVYCGALPQHGLGICIKTEDGAGRACEVSMGRVLQQLGVIDDADFAKLEKTIVPPVRNWEGTVTGRIQPAAAAQFCVCIAEYARPPLHRPRQAGRLARGGAARPRPTR